MSDEKKAEEPVRKVVHDLRAMDYHLETVEGKDLKRGAPKTRYDDARASQRHRKRVQEQRQHGD